MLVLRDAFCGQRICAQDGIQIINGASVPIIRLTDRKTDIKVDMSFNMNNGLRCAQLILVCARRVLPEKRSVISVYLLTLPNRSCIERR